MMKIGVIVQARLTSARFPNKVLAKLGNKPVLEHVLDNVIQTGLPVVVAIPENPENDILYEWLLCRNFETFRGLQHDVLDRYYKANKKYKFDIIIRVNGETPFIRPEDILINLNRFIKEKRFIYGNGSWVFSKDMLEEAWNNEFDAETRQHVVRYFFDAVDYPQDIKRLEKKCKIEKRL